MSFESSLRFVGREGEHYSSLEQLRNFSLGNTTLSQEMVKGVAKTIKDWTEMLGSKSSMISTCDRYLSRILVGDRNAARTLYMLVSPIFFYVHTLYQLQREAWRTAVTACGIFCERVVRNLLIAIDARAGGEIYKDFEDKTFEMRNGKVKSELEKVFHKADDLFFLLKIVYSTRSTTGPHDVPPPEPDQARINLTFCYPIYLLYLQALSQLGNDLSADSSDFITFMKRSAQLEVALAFGQESENKPAKLIVKERLYRLGFFSEDRTLTDIHHRLVDLRYSYSPSLLAHCLTELSTGRDAVLTRTKRNGVFHYRERLSPTEYFGTVL